MLSETITSDANLGNSYWVEIPWIIPAILDIQSNFWECVNNMTDLATLVELVGLIEKCVGKIFLPLS